MVNKPFAELSFFQRTHKFPNTKEGVVLEHYFKYKNTGTAPLIIHDAKVSCSCTKVYFSKEPLAPGSSDSMRVTFDTKDKSYFQDREILILCNGRRSSSKIRVKVKVE
jgi:hypothetical protein